MKHHNEIYYLAKECGANPKSATIISNRIAFWSSIKGYCSPWNKLCGKQDNVCRKYEEIGVITTRNQLKRVSMNDLCELEKENGIGKERFQIIMKMKHTVGGV